MKRKVIIGMGAALLVWGVSSAWARVPNTLSFQNVTATKVVQTVPETSAEGTNHEKEVEYGDFDNDGDLDVVVAVGAGDFGRKKNKLYRNNAGVFNEISGAPVIPGFSTIDVSRNAFFRDYNMDGWLDIIVINDANTLGDGGRTKLYINKQVAGVFDHYDEEGLARLGSSTGGAACGGVSADFNEDGMTDLYVGNYPGPSQDTMYFDGANAAHVLGYFTAMTTTHVPTDGDYTVDMSTADMNGDGSLDLLLSNDLDPNYIYYNDNDTDGSSQGKGDFQYGASGYGGRQSLGLAGVGENAMEPGDFNGDGRNDIYWSNAVGSTGARIKINTGNNASGVAQFSDFSALPVAATNRTSRKATVSDLNDDGRPDIFVMIETASTNNRPVILRNTTVGGVLSFIDWTPAPAFPATAAMRGWHAAAFDADGDTFKDVFLGGWVNDHLFKNIGAVEYLEDSLPGNPVKTLPAIFNAEPIVITGNATSGADVYEAAGIVGTAGAPAFISLSLRGSADYRLEVLDASNNVLVTSNRGANGVEEALMRTETTSVTRRIRVTQLSVPNCGATGDGDDDGDCDLDDHMMMQSCAGSSVPSCLMFDFDGSGTVDAGDLAGFGTQMAGPDIAVSAGSCEYVLEILSRNN